MLSWQKIENLEHFMSRGQHRLLLIRSCQKNEDGGVEKRLHKRTKVFSSGMHLPSSHACTVFTSKEIFLARSSTLSPLCLRIVLKFRPYQHKEMSCFSIGKRLLFQTAFSIANSADKTMKRHFIKC